MLCFAVQGPQWVLALPVPGYDLSETCAEEFCFLGYRVKEMEMVSMLPGQYGD